MLSTVCIHRWSCGDNPKRRHPRSRASSRLDNCPHQGRYLEPRRGGKVNSACHSRVQIPRKAVVAAAVLPMAKRTAEHIAITPPRERSIVKSAVVSILTGTADYNYKSLSDTLHIRGGGVRSFFKRLFGGDPNPRPRRRHRHRRHGRPSRRNPDSSSGSGGGSVGSGEDDWNYRSGRSRVSPTRHGQRRTRSYTCPRHQTSAGTYRRRSREPNHSSRRPSSQPRNAIASKRDTVSIPTYLLSSFPVHDWGCVVLTGYRDIHRGLTGRDQSSIIHLMRLPLVAIADNTNQLHEQRVLLLISIGWYQSRLFGATTAPPEKTERMSEQGQFGSPLSSQHLPLACRPSQQWPMNRSQTIRIQTMLTWMQTSYLQCSMRKKGLQIQY